MTIAAGIASGGHSEQVGQVFRRDPAKSDDEVVAPVSNLEFLGAAAASGHRQPPSLVRRADGQTLQLTPLLYQVLEAVDGRRTLAAIAVVVSERAGRLLTPDDVRFLIDRKLRPLGLLRDAQGNAPPAAKANPLLALRWRIVVSNPDITDSIANKFAPLFHPACIALVMTAFIATTGWVFFDMGLSHPARAALYDPSLLIGVFLLTAASAAFHEVGHASACRYGGARPGVMGAGLYLLWPAFYTDVSDAYRLDRWGRLRVDLGGIYFNAVFALGAIVLYWASGTQALLLVVPLQLLQMVRHLAPLVRLDGYHILADLTGVPDLFAHIRPVLLGLLPWRWGRPENKALHPWARFLVTAWVLLVVPLLTYSFVVLIVVFPRLAATSWDSLGYQWIALRTAAGKGEVATVGAVVISMAALVLPVVSISYIVVRMVRRIVRNVWRATSGHPMRRSMAVAAGLALVALLVSTWLPDSQRQPIASGERGTIDVPGMKGLTSATAPANHGAASASASTARDAVSNPAANFSTNKPTHIALAFIPRPDASTAVTTPAQAPPWQSPIGNVRFNPPTPGPGDNFATVVNTQDGSFLVATKFSLVFADGDEVANRNRAYALANCNNCSTMSVAFQVILIVSDADVITPDNLAFAINAACAVCDTRALAMQLIATTGPLNDRTVARILDVWQPLVDAAEQMASQSLAQVQQQLFQVESQILGVLVDENVVAISSNDSQQTDGGTTSTTTTSPSPASDASTASVDASSTSSDASSTTSSTDETVTTTTTPDTTSTTSDTTPETTTSTTTDTTPESTPSTDTESSAPPTSSS